jgi:hypothetical protein
MTSFQIIERDNYKISLIELFPCNLKDELSAREGYYIRNIKCVNKQIPGRTQKEWCNDNPDKFLKTQKNEVYFKCPYRNNIDFRNCYLSII